MKTFIFTRISTAMRFAPLHVLPLFAILATLVMLAIPADSSLAQVAMDRDRIDRISLAVVQVHTPDGTGSGSLVEGSGLIYTNRHVVEGFYEFDIHALKDPTEPAQPVFKAELVGYSDEYDFAVLRVTTDMAGNAVTDPHGYLRSVAPAGLAPELRAAGLREVPGRGDHIAIFGYPGIGDNELVYTTGIISSVQYDEFAGTRMPVWYRTNAEMSPGNSGGIATNAAGEIIGIPTYVRTESRTGGRLGSLLSMHVVNAIVEAGALNPTWEPALASVGSGTAAESESGWYGDELDYSMDPYYGENSLAAGFTPDPFRVTVTAGGSVAAAYLGGGCTGFAAQAPDYRLSWSGSSAELRFFFRADDSGDDTVIIINKPDGSWACNDDADEGDGLDPMLVLANPPAGRYDIWVGSYNEGDFVAGTLYITERPLSPGSDLTALAPGSGSGTGAGSGSGTGTSGTGAGPAAATATSLDFGRDPNYGTISLDEYFTPDPDVTTLVSGGSVDVASLGLGAGCTGYASSAPDLRLNWSGSTSDLRIFFEPDQPGNDTVLIINTPDGRWLCNDDAYSGTLNPMLDLNGQPQGQFDIWVASYRSGSYVQGRLTVTERDLRP
jgi:S1-C subfamily serine protease